MIVVPNSVGPYARRVACAEALLRARAAASGRGWSSAEWRRRADDLLTSSRSADAGGLNTDATAVEGLLLVGREWLAALRHPEHPTVQRIVYGDDTFDPLAYSEPCESARLWGYACPFGEMPIRADHLFPRALGGPTDSRNRLTLCHWHNTAKSMDIHIFPFEEGLPAWVVDVLGSMSSWM